MKNPKHPNHNNYTGHIGYDEFIREYISDGERKPYAKLRTQYKFIALNNGQIGVDHIMPLDRIDLVAEYLSNKIGKTVNLLLSIQFFVLINTAVFFGWIRFLLGRTDVLWQTERV